MENLAERLEEASNKFKLNRTSQSAKEFMLAAEKAFEHALIDEPTFLVISRELNLFLQDYPEQ